MKDSGRYSKELKKLVTRLKRTFTVEEEGAGDDLTTELVLACLSQNTTEAKARTALHRLRGSFVDMNELRVSRSAEIAEVLGKSFPEPRTTARQIAKLLHGVYEQLDTLSLESLREMGKREAKAWLEALEGSDAYVVARLMLRGLGAHAVPVHEAMLAMLREEQVVDPEADAATVQGFLERQISAQHVLRDYQLLRKHTDSPAPKPAATKKAARKKTTTKKAATKKTKKKTVKKTTKKAATKKKTKRTSKKA